MTKRGGWVLGVGLTACTPGTKGGGELVDGSGSTSHGEASGTDDPSGDTTGGEEACIAAPSCGNGRVEILEECDGTDGCSACASTQAPTPVMDSGEFGAITIAFAADGSWLATTQAFEGQPVLLRRFDPAGAELWSRELVDLAQVRPSVALDPAGNAYLGAGMQAAVDDPVFPWVAAWDAAGEPSWSVVGTEPGDYNAISADGERVVVVGADVVEGGSTGVMRLFDADGGEQWTHGGGAYARMDDVLLVDAEIVAMGSRPGLTEPNTSVTIIRYDLLATERWALEVAADEPPAIGRWGIAPDGAAGAWTFGARLGSPWAIRHDRDGALIEEIDCIGGGEGVVAGLAVGSDRRLALAVVAQTYVDQNYNAYAWFPVLDDGEIVAATRFDSSTGTAFALATAWSGDRRLVVWTDGGSEGGPGRTRVLQIP